MDPTFIGQLIGTAFAAALVGLAAGWPIMNQRIRKAKAEAKQGAVAAVEAKADEAEQKHAARVDFWESWARKEMEGFKQREADLNARLTAKYELAAALENRVESLETERDAGHRKIAELEAAAEARAEAYNQRIGELESELHTLRARVDQLQKDNQQLERERDDGRTRERALQARVENQEREIGDLQRRIIALEAEKGVLEKLLDRLEIVRVKTQDSVLEPAAEGHAP